MNNIVNQIAYLRTTRDFPEELHQLSIECNKAYLDTANAVNSRTIGIFPTNRPAVTGESWFIQGNRRQQTFRQVYTFTSSTTLPIPHGLDFNGIDYFTRCWGGYLDVLGNWNGIIWTTSIPIAGQLTFYLTPTLIFFLGGAPAPAIVKGEVILEWMSQP